MESKLREIASLVSKGKATKEQEEFIVGSFQKVFGKRYNLCNCQLIDAIFMILKKLKNMNECKFKLKRGVVLTSFGKPYKYTYDNLTNEGAIAHLTEHPEDAKLFDYIPNEFKNKAKGKAVTNIIDEVIEDKPEVVHLEDEEAYPAKKKPVKKHK